MHPARPVLLLTLLSGAATAAANPLACRWGDLERTIEVMYAEPGQAVPCEVLYKLSEGEQRVLWRADHETGYCEARAAELADKLAGLGWSCQTSATQALPE